MIEQYLGVDYHRRRCYVVCMDKAGDIMDQRRLPNEEMAAYLDSLPHNTLAVLEATRSWQHMYGLLSQKLEEVLLVHPNKVRAIASARIKTDRIDATTLAHLARTNLFPTAYAPPIHIREDRDLARHRSKLVRDRTRLKNRVHDILARYGLSSPVSDLLGKKGRNYLRQVLPTLSATHQTMLSDDLTLIDHLNHHITLLSSEITRRASRQPAVTLLRSIPGIGTYSGFMISAEIGDINRFSGPKQLCSYAGLVPSTYSSDDRTYHGSITKQGSAWLRWIMVEAAQKAPHFSRRLNAFYCRILYRKGNKPARVALARKMLSIAFYMLKNGEFFREN